LENYQIKFVLKFSNVINIVLKLHIKPIVIIKAWNIINYINLFFIYMMDDYGH
jgi:hypothetical protein